MRTMTAVRISCAVAHLLSFGLVPVFTSSVFPGNPHVSSVLFLTVPRSSRRRSTVPDVMNVGPENREPSQQIGYAHSSLPLLPPSSFSADGDVLSVVGGLSGVQDEVLHVVEGLMGILKVSPEHSKAVAPAVDLIKKQVMQIEELKGVLEAVRTELSSMMGGLDSADVLVIKSL